MTLSDVSSLRRNLLIVDSTATEGRINIKELGAVGDGVTDDSPVFEYALSSGCRLTVPEGVYYFASGVTLPDGGVLDMEGTGTAIIRAASGVIPFQSKMTYPFTYIHKVRLQNIIFDGERVRGTFPYMDSAGDTYGLFTAVFAAAEVSDISSEIDIRGCTFENIASLPILFDHFKRVTVIGNHFYKTRDPGFRFCNNVRFQANTSEFGSDNGVSISRGCKNVVLTDNVFKDCEAAGLWLSGFDVNLSSSGRSATVTGTYTAGSSATLTISGSSFFSPKHIGTTMTLTDGSSNSGVVKIESVTGTNTASVTVLLAIPAAIQGVSTTNFQEAPHNGVSNFTCANNTIVGGYIAGIHAGEGPNRGTISGNTIVRSGFLADSEVSSIGTVAASSTSLVVEDGSLFTADDYILIEPRTSLQDYFIGQVASVTDDTITLTAAPPETYTNEPVYLCHLNASTGYGIFIFGQITGITRPAQYLNISGNMLDEYKSYGIVLGTTATYPSSDVSITNNYFTQSKDIVDATKSAVYISEATGTTMANITVANNTADAAHNNLVELRQRGVTLRSITVVNNNTSATKLTALDSDDSNNPVAGYTAS